MYSSRVREDLVQRLYPLCQRLGVPMTVFVNNALERAVVEAEEGAAKTKGLREEEGKAAAG